MFLTNYHGIPQLLYVEQKNYSRGVPRFIAKGEELKITFVGHSSLKISDDLKKTIYETIKNNILPTDKIMFLCGGYGDFDNMCAKICHDLNYALKKGKNVINLANQKDRER